MKEEIVDKYCWAYTCDICMEEAGELVHALNKYKRACGIGYETQTKQSDARINLIQAIADAQNAIDSVIYALDIDKKEIEKEINRADEQQMNLLGIGYEIKKKDEKQAKNEFHSEKCSIKNNDAYPEMYWIEKEIGGETIIRKPFIPRKGQLYYYVDADRIVSSTCFLGSIEDKLKIAMGNCFKTSEQAQANVDIIMKRLEKAKDYWNVVIID